MGGLFGFRVNDWRDNSRNILELQYMMYSFDSYLPLLFSKMNVQTWAEYNLLSLIVDEIKAEHDQQK